MISLYSISSKLVQEEKGAVASRRRRGKPQQQRCVCTILVPFLPLNCTSAVHSITTTQCSYNMLYSTQQREGQSGGPGDLRPPPNFCNNKTKCVFSKNAIKVCVSCYRRCPGTSTSRAAHLTVSLYLCSSEATYALRLRGPGRCVSS